MDSHWKNLEMHDPPEGSSKCSDFWGEVSVGWFVPFPSPSQIQRKSNSPVRKSRCSLPEVQEGAGTCQDILIAARNSGSSGRDSKGILLVTSAEPAFQSTLFRQPRIRARQLKTLSATGYVPILALSSCPNNHHSSRREGGKILSPKPKADKLGFPAHTPLLFIDCSSLGCKSKSSSDDFSAITFVREEDRKLKKEN